jgi:hypothetical protein
MCSLQTGKVPFAQINIDGYGVYRDLSVFRKQLMVLGRTQSRQLTPSNIAVSLRRVVHPLVS